MEKEKSRDLKVIKLWSAIFLAVLLVASCIVGSIYLRANSCAKKWNDHFTKEEAVEKAIDYISDYNTEYRKHEYTATETKTELVFTLGKAKDAYHVYHITLKGDNVVVTVKVNASYNLSRSASIEESNISKVK